MNDRLRTARRLGFWRVWGPLVACVVLTGIALSLLIISGASPARILLLAIALGCPVVLAILWRMHHTGT